MAPTPIGPRPVDAEEIIRRLRLLRYSPHNRANVRGGRKIPLQYVAEMASWKAGTSFGDLHGGHRRRSVVRGRTVRLSVLPKCFQAIERFTVTEKLFQFLPRQYLESIT
jgi:hypothetical protein